MSIVATLLDFPLGIDGIEELISLGTLQTSQPLDFVEGSSHTTCEGSLKPLDETFNE
ncbi:hypothetical protein BZG36_05768, partial [Bifiguratus adelaidae]